MAQYDFELETWYKKHEGYIKAIALKYAPIWGVEVDEALAWINSQLPDIRSRCKGNFTPAYAASSLIRRRISERRTVSRHAAEVAHGSVELSEADAYTNQPIEDQDGMVLTVSLRGECQIVTIYDGQIASSIHLGNVGRIMIQATEGQARIYDCG